MISVLTLSLMLNFIGFARSLTVSGLSSGGFFASQFHVAYSSTVTGAGIISGGPYYCTENSINYSNGACWSSADLINIPSINQYLKKSESENKIDEISNLESSKVYIFTGTKDTKVTKAVGEQALNFYSNYIKPGNIIANFDVPSEHAWVTDFYGNSCDYFGAPLINNCGYDMAGKMLNHLLGDLRPRVEPKAENFYSFSQEKYGKIDDAGMAKLGYIYVPDDCMIDICDVHVVFHACKQAAEFVDEKFVRNNGINNWAESNSFVVIYPQLRKTDKNPRGCWDYYGYTGENYAVKSGEQMSFIYNMVTNIPIVHWEKNNYLF